MKDEVDYFPQKLKMERIELLELAKAYGDLSNCHIFSVEDLPPVDFMNS